MWLKYIEDTDTLLIRLSNDPVYESEYLEDEGIVVDYNDKNEIVGYEIFGWSKIEREGKELSIRM